MLKKNKEKKISTKIFHFRDGAERVVKNLICKVCQIF